MKALLNMFLAVVLILFCIVHSQSQVAADDKPTFDERLKTLVKDVGKLLGISRPPKTDVPVVKNLLKQLGILDELQKIEGDLVCGACQAVVKELQSNTLSVENIGKAICNLYYSLTTLTVTSFCSKVVAINKPILEYIVKESEILTPKYACSIWFQNSNCYDFNSTSLSWRIAIPEGGPAVNTNKTSSNETAKSPLKILHLSDFHISFDYQIGSVADCGYPVCCKRGLGSILKQHNAGPWGDYNCDISVRLLENTMIYINNTHKDIDLIYFTGDIIDHTVWKASTEDNSREISYTFKLLADSFPNISVLPAIGNHEAAPLNVFAPPNITDEKFSQTWLYNLNAKLLAKWIPHENLTSVKNQGYFSSTSANHKLRIIVLNNNVCYNLNWWLLYDTSFLKEQLEFLKRELLEAENRGQYVHIVSHVFPGTKECIEPWEVNYDFLVTRFSHIIKGQFFGHTHTDGLKVFYSKTDRTPISVGYNGASLTPIVKYNPNYKIVNVDRDTFEVLDIETYYFNLTEANLHKDRTPRWQLLYSMKKAYNFDQLSPKNFDSLARRMADNTTLFNQYWRYFVRDGDASLKEGYDEELRDEMISEITRTESITPP